MPELSDAVRDAEDAVAALADNFLDWIAEDIARAKAALEAAGAKPGDNLAELHAIFEVMHNIKGQGSTFGYNLLTKMAGSLCDYIRDAAHPADTRQVKVMAAHFAAIDFILDKKLKGDGGDAGAQLTARIGELVASVPGPG